MEYNVYYIINGTKYSDPVRAPHPAAAMAKILHKYPEAKLIKAWKQGDSDQFDSGYCEWKAPEHVEGLIEPGPARELKKNERGCEFPFYDEVIGTK